MNTPRFMAGALRQHPDLQRMMATVAAAALLVLLFVLTQPIDIGQHNRLLAHFSQLQRDEALLGEEVLQLNFSLSIDYDQATTLMGHLESTAKQLREGGLARDLRTHPDFERQLQVLSERLAVKRHALERFKSRNSVLKNSLIYLPSARDEVLGGLHARHTGVRDPVNALLENVLINRINGALSDRADIARQLERLHNVSTDWPEPVRRKMQSLLRHVRLIDRFEQELPLIVGQLTSQGDAQGLAQAYAAHHDQQQRRASLYRAFLLVATLVLMAYGFRVLDRLRSQTSKLKLAAGVFTHAREGIIITDASASIVDVNEAFTRITGYSREEVLGQNPRMLGSGRNDRQFYEHMWSSLLNHGHWYGEVWNRRKNGEVYAEMETISAVRDHHGQVGHYIALFSDITAQKEHAARLEHIAHFDALTGLPNRLLLADRMQQAMGQALRRGERLAVAFLDLDGFKAVNDTLGHEAGDRLLMALAKRMKSILRDGDALARLGGDEFVVVLNNQSGLEATVPLLERLLQAVSDPMDLGGSSGLVQVSASIGLTYFPQAEEVDADQLMRQADQAMYQAKLAGKNRYHLFDAELDRSVRGHYESVERIREALARGELVLYYQPKVNMRTGLVIGAEALIRWRHPQRGLLLPGEFLPIIEGHPLAVELGQWVIDAALAQMQRWQAQGLAIPVSVNVGAIQLQQADFVAQLGRQLAAHEPVCQGWLTLEVLETSALEDLARMSRVILDCQAVGVAFALDDFGTGYSSLTYLKRLPVSQLKIDQSFVRGVVHDPQDRAILESVLSLAKAFHREVIAEGVETVAHGALLLQLGCELGQGYGIAHPMPAADFPAWAASWRPDPQWDIPLNVAIGSVV